MHELAKNYYLLLELIYFHKKKTFCLFCILCNKCLNKYFNKYVTSTKSNFNLKQKIKVLII